MLDLTAFTSIVARARVADQPTGPARHNPTPRSPVQPLVDRRSSAPTPSHPTRTPRLPTTFLTPRPPAGSSPSG